MLLAATDRHVPGQMLGLYKPKKCKAWGCVRERCGNETISVAIPAKDQNDSWKLEVRRKGFTWKKDASKGSGSWSLRWIKTIVSKSRFSVVPEKEDRIYTLTESGWFEPSEIYFIRITEANPISGRAACEYLKEHEAYQAEEEQVASV